MIPVAAMGFLYEQLPLAFQRQHHATLESFVAGGNSALLFAIDQMIGGAERYIYIHGTAGSGRSHLLQASCHRAEQRGLSSVYLPLAELGDYDPQSLFEGLEGLQLVCLDDIDAVLGKRDWETGLFSLYNALAEADCRLLVSASSAVRELQLSLEDLRSRLSSGPIYQLLALDEARQQQVVRERARALGLELSAEVIQFIFQRSQRDLDSLLQILDTLDQASLREQRRLTIPFIKSTLGW